GPRIGDDAIKPEVTAPGVDIVAARASGVPPIGTPVGTAYMALSGTSMATPHVAGAAALILQQHPAWTGAQLKAQLMASAHPTAGLDVFAQGAGRIDVDRGTRQDVAAEPAALSLGIAQFPHDDDPPIVRSVRYHNGGSAPITLALAATLAGPAGPGVVSVAPATITVPAGGTSDDVVVTVRTDGELANGLYSGALIATAGDIQVETPIGVNRDLETFELTLASIVDGAPSDAFVDIVSLPDQVFQFVLFNDTTTIRLPRGLYALDASLLRATTGVTLVYPRFTVDHDATVTFDSAIAQPVDVDVGDPGVAPTMQSWQYVDYATGYTFSSLGFGVPIAAGQLGPDLPADEFVGWTFDSFSDHQFFPTRTYHVARSARGRLPDGFHGTIAPDQFATIEAHHAGVAGASYRKGVLALLDDGARGLQSSFTFVLDVYEQGSFDRTERFFGPGFVWEQELVDARTLPGQPFPTTVVRSIELRSYAPGTHSTEIWNRAPTGPAFAATTVFTDQPLDQTSSASRTGDELFVFPSMVADPATPARRITTLASHERVALLRDGAPFFEDDAAGPALFLDLPPEPATYRYEHELDRDPALFAHSTHVSAAWTFRSAHVAGDAPRSLPLLTMRYLPALDDQGTTAARVLVLPIRFERPPFAGTPLVTQASLEASFDDGAHWHHVPLAVLGDRALAVIIHPRGSQDVSLRSTARDLAGNQLEQTIVRAYSVR
ncbi:MAG: S8 family serine peptidase, partial [Kofleriaceae bacterium]